jgi:hypothetical protein
LPPGLPDDVAPGLRADGTVCEGLLRAGSADFVGLACRCVLGFSPAVPDVAALASLPGLTSGIASVAASAALRVGDADDAPEGAEADGAEADAAEAASSGIGSFCREDSLGLAGRASPR